MSHDAIGYKIPGGVGVDGEGVGMHGWGGGKDMWMGRR